MRSGQRGRGQQQRADAGPAAVALTTLAAEPVLMTPFFVLPALVLATNAEPICLPTIAPVT